MASLMADRKKVLENQYKSKSMTKGGALDRTKLPGDDNKKKPQDMSKGKNTSIERLQKRIKTLQSQNDAYRKRLRKGSDKSNARFNALIKKNLEQIKMMQNIIRERTRDDAPKKSKNPPVDDRMDSGGPEGEEFRRGGKNQKSSKKESKGGDLGRVDMSDFKPKSDDSGDDRGPKNKKRDDQKKKNKKSMLGNNRFMSGKGRYGDIKPGVYKGQR